MASSKSKTSTKLASIGIAAVVAATQGPNGFLFVGQDEGNQLAAAGLVELNPNVPNTPAGQVAARATAAGIAQAGGAPVASTDTAKPTFEIEDNVPIPAVSGRGRIGSTYPFDALAVGQSFFVPKAAKNLASTVSSANARYATEVPGETRTDRKGNVVPKMTFTRQFIVRSVEGGSRIWRKV